ncbi:MAG: hypothetical protein ACK55I_49515, partial [bacterium]
LYAYKLMQWDMNPPWWRFRPLKIWRRQLSARKARLAASFPHHAQPASPSCSRSCSSSPLCLSDRRRAQFGHR